MAGTAPGRVVSVSDPAPGSPGGPLWDPEAIPAATIIPLRDAAGELEVLMLRRDDTLRFAAGMWVFPGGRLDPEDFPGGSAPSEPTAGDLEAAARAAALREADEEASITIEPATIRRWSQWTPPPMGSGEKLRHRFTTAFLVGVAVGDTDAIVVDDGEIREHRWCSPPAMLELHALGEVSLAPPTFITLCQLATLRNPAEVLMAAPSGMDDIEHFATRVGSTDGGWAALYHGDAAYESGDMEATGARHRLHMDSLPWRYERDVTGTDAGDHPDGPA